MKVFLKIPVLFFLGFLICILQCSSEEVESKEYSGTFYANDCGVSHGGHEWAGSYSASLIVEGSQGDLEINLEIGLGDYLVRHEFKVTDFSETVETLNFKIDGRQVSLVFVEEDTVWNGDYDNFYIANNSDNSSEQIGMIPIEVFFGFRPHYYVELRLKPDQNSSSGTKNLLF